MKSTYRVKYTIHSSFIMHTHIVVQSNERHVLHLNTRCEILGNTFKSSYFSLRQCIRISPTHNRARHGLATNHIKCQIKRQPASNKNVSNALVKSLVPVKQCKVHRFTRNETVHLNKWILTEYALVVRGFTGPVPHRTPFASAITRLMNTTLPTPPSVRQLCFRLRGHVLS